MHEDYDRQQAEKWGQQPQPNYYYYYPQQPQQAQQPSLYPPLAKKRGNGPAIAALVCSACAIGLFFLAVCIVLAGSSRLLRCVLSRQGRKDDTSRNEKRLS